MEKTFELIDVWKFFELGIIFKDNKVIQTNVIEELMNKALERSILKLQLHEQLKDSHPSFQMVRKIKWCFPKHMIFPIPLKRVKL